MDRVRPVDRVQLLTLALAVTLGAGSPAAAGSLRLSDEAIPLSEARRPQASPDGRWVVYTHATVELTTRELWSVPAVGGDPIHLSGVLAVGDEVANFAISPDSTRVVFTRVLRNPIRTRLYSVPIGGGIAVALHPTLPPERNTGHYEITPDSSQVVFRADLEVAGVFHLWSVPIDGGTAVPLHTGNPHASGDVTAADWRLTADGSRVVYRANYLDPAKIELWSNLLDGSDPVRINGSLVTGGNVWGFELAPNGTQLVYRADQAIDEVYELYRASIASGGTAVRLNPALPAGRSVRLEFAISSDGARVVYIANQAFATVHDLWSVPLGGGASTKLNPGLVLGGDVHEFGLLADGSTVVYRADQVTNGIDELFSVPIAGGTVHQLFTPIGGPSFYIDRFWMAPAGDRLVYRVVWGSEGRRLYGVDAKVGMASHYGIWPWGGGPQPDASDVAFSPDATRVFFQGERQDVGGGNTMIYGMPFLGPGFEPILISGPMVEGGLVWSGPVPHPDGGQVLYTANQETLDRIHLYIGDLCLLCDGFEAGDFRRWQ